MIALDTNILARLLLDDDARQAARAERLLAAHPAYWVPVTVVLELAWVLKAEGYDRKQAVEALRRVTALANVRTQHAEAVERALQWAEGGLDVADALHLALSGSAASFATLDARLHKRVAGLAIAPATMLA